MVMQSITFPPRRVGRRQIASQSFGKDACGDLCVEGRPVVYREDVALLVEWLTTTFRLTPVSAPEPKAEPFDRVLAPAPQSSVWTVSAPPDLFQSPPPPPAPPAPLRRKLTPEEVKERLALGGRRAWEKRKARELERETEIARLRAIVEERAR
jgi:hypothetical protein